MYLLSQLKQGLIVRCDWQKIINIYKDKIFILQGYRNDIISRIWSITSVTPSLLNSQQMSNLIQIPMTRKIWKSIFVAIDTHTNSHINIHTYKHTHTHIHKLNRTSNILYMFPFHLFIMYVTIHNKITIYTHTHTHTHTHIYIYIHIYIYNIILSIFFLSRKTIYLEMNIKYQ